MMKKNLVNILGLLLVMLVFTACSKDAELYTPGEARDAVKKSGKVMGDENDRPDSDGDITAAAPTRKDNVDPISDVNDDDHGISDDDDDESDDDTSIKNSIPNK